MNKTNQKTGSQPYDVIIVGALLVLSIALLMARAVRVDHNFDQALSMVAEKTQHDRKMIFPDHREFTQAICFRERPNPKSYRDVCYRNSITRSLWPNNHSPEEQAEMFYRNTYLSGDIVYVTTVYEE